MSIYFANIVRLSDKLELATSVEDDASVAALKKAARAKYSEITSTSQPRQTFPVGEASLHFFISGLVFVCCATDKLFPIEEAYRFLEEIAEQFLDEHGETVPGVERPLYFVGFHSTIEARRHAAVGRVHDSSVRALHNEIEGVKNTMAETLRESFKRKGKVEDLSAQSEEVVRNATHFAKDAKQLNQRHIWRTYGRPSVILAIVGLCYGFVALLI